MSNENPTDSDSELADLRRQVAELEARLTAQKSEIQQTGTGGLAHGAGAKAGGQGSVVADQIHGNVYVGNVPQNEQEALAIYRRVYVAACRQLPLRGIDIGTSDATGDQQRLDLDQVYIALDTTTRVDSERVDREEGEAIRRPQPSLLLEWDKEAVLSLLDAAIQYRRLVILGAPGSGKSTFLNHLGLCLALQGSEPDQDWIRRLPKWPPAESTLLPITVTLRDFAQTMPTTPQAATPDLLWQFITKRLQAQNLGFVADYLHQALEKAGKTIVLLDGLDEIPAQRQRTFVRDCVIAFAERYTHTRLLVTCRTLSYQDPSWQLGALPSVEIAPFDQAKIQTFIAAWYATLARLNVITLEEANRLAHHLQEAVTRPELGELADNPLLLTVMALVHTHRGRLPDARALLYEETIDILLWRWEEIKAGADETSTTLRRLLHEANRADVDLKRVLWQLAYTMQAQGTAEDGLADIHEFTLQKALTELHPKKDRNWAYTLIQTMKLRAGLLLERAPEVYTFPHRTFQEYLAGSHLAAEGKFAQTAAALAAEGAFWRPTILLAVGRLVYLGGDTDKPLALVGELCPQRLPTGEAGWRNVWLAGDVLLEMGLHRVRDSVLGQDLLDRVQQHLVKLLQAGALVPGERAAAGDVLAQLGDPRFAADTWSLPAVSLAEPLLGLIEIPAGPFIMGRDPAVEEDVDAWEQPPHAVTLPTYYMARYPVTVAQFRAFCDDSDYQPKDPDSLREPANRPVRWITWYEALRYCAWLTETLRAWSGTPEPLATLLRVGTDGNSPWCITLPSEAEWEKAARGLDGRIYPWGNEPNPNAMNGAESGINDTGAVGAFPAGTSPYGCLDMAGNVWAWTRSLWGKDLEKPDFGYPYEPADGREDLNAADNFMRVVRGGAVGCGVRDWDLPLGRDHYIGFRIVASPFTSDL